jgi:hypothetical protein
VPRPDAAVSGSDSITAGYGEGVAATELVVRYLATLRPARNQPRAVDHANGQVRNVGEGPRRLSHHPRLDVSPEYGSDGERPCRSQRMFTGRSVINQRDEDFHLRR